MFANIRGTQIYFDIEGAGLVPDGDRMREKPIAFLIHGGPGADHSSYKPTFSALSDRMQLVYFDHRGQGRSARGDKSKYTLDENVEDMEALRQHLGLGKIIAIAQYLWNGNFESEEQLGEYFRIMHSLYSYTADPTKTVKSRTILSIDAINEAFGGFLRSYTVLDRLHKITVPTLVIAGRHDWICPPEFSEEIAQAIPNADLRIFENSGHLIRVDEPKALLDTIAGFIQKNK